MALAIIDPVRSDVIWADRICALAFETTALDEITDAIFQHPSARALGSRLRRLHPGDPDQLERIVVRSGFQIRTATLVCRAVVEEGAPYILARIAAPWIEEGWEESGAPDPAPAEELVAEDCDRGASQVTAADLPGKAEQSDDSVGARLRELPSTRFVFECDREGVLTRIGPEWEQAVGDSAPAMGSNLIDALMALDPGDGAALAGVLAARRSWSGQTVRWPVAGTALLLPVALSGAPLPGRQGGFRGFGSLLVQDLQAQAPVEGAIADGPAEPAPSSPDGSDDVAVSVPVATSAAPMEQAGRPAADDSGSGESGGDAPPAETAAPFAISSAPEPVTAWEACDPDVASPPPAVASANPPIDPVVAEPPNEMRLWTGHDLSKVVDLLSFKAGGSPTQQGAPPIRSLPRLVPSGFRAPVEDPPAEAPLWSESPELATDEPSDPSVLSHSERDALDEISRTLHDQFGPPAVRSADGAAGELTAESDGRPVQSVELPAPAGLPEAVPAEPAPEEAARELIEASEALLDRVPLAMLVLRDGRSVFGNRALLDLLGFGSVDAIETAGGVASLLADDERGPDGTQLVQTRSGGTRRAIVRLQAADWGGEAATLLSIQPTDSESEARAEAILLDLKRSQGSVADLQQTLDVAAHAVVVTDAGGRILSLNRGAEEVFGFDQKEVAGDDASLFLSPDQHNDWAELLSGFKGVDGPEPVRVRMTARKRNGDMLPMGIKIGSLPGGRICIVFDNEASQQDTEQELEAARRDAERSSTLKSEFLAKVSHEIRTPLNAILGFAEVMRDERLGPIGNDRYKDYLRDIHASGTHVMSLVNDLLDLSRIEAGRLDLKLVPVNVNAVVSDCVGTLQNQAHRERVIMRLSLPPRLPSILADERTLRQIILNLLSNAVKFNEPGGQVIVSTALVGNGRIAVRVRDTGFGMSDSDIATAMEPFRQLATPKATAGSGLGLPLTKALVDASQATMVIKSRPQEGTLVEVTFLQAEAESLSVPAE